MVGERRLADMEQGGEVRVPKKDISEPSFGFGRGGDREFVLPGNREYVAGDRIPRPEGGGGGGGNGSAAATATARTTSCSRCRAKSSCRSSSTTSSCRISRAPNIGRTEQHKSIRAGFTKTGVPGQSRGRAHDAPVAGAPDRARRRHRARGSRRWRRRSPSPSAVGHAERGRGLHEELERLTRRRGKLPFLDEPDLRYRNRVWRPEPIARAVMFCLMDVSASMDEDKKDLAKRFFTLLYLFLTRKYGEVDLVFIRHTDDAEEVDEDTFFHDTRSGGTVVYSALELADKIRAERYARGWNVYAAQASDGDAFGADPARSARFLREQLLPATRYYTYLELAAPRLAGPSVDAVGRVRARRARRPATSRCGARRGATRSIRCSASCSKEAQ